MPTLIAMALVLTVTAPLLHYKRTFLDNIFLRVSLTAWSVIFHLQSFKQHAKANYCNAL